MEVSIEGFGRTRASALWVILMEDCRALQNLLSNWASLSYSRSCIEYLKTVGVGLKVLVWQTQKQQKNKRNVAPLLAESPCWILLIGIPKYPTQSWRGKWCVMKELENLSSQTTTGSCRTSNLIRFLDLLDLFCWSIMYAFRLEEEESSS